MRTILCACALLVGCVPTPAVPPPDATEAVVDADLGTPPRGPYLLQLVPEAAPAGCSRAGLEVFFVFDGVDFDSAYTTFEATTMTALALEIRAAWTDVEPLEVELGIAISGEDLAATGTLHEGVCTYAVTGVGKRAFPAPTEPPPGGCFPGVNCP